MGTAKSTAMAVEGPGLRVAALVAVMVTSDVSVAMAKDSGRTGIFMSISINALRAHHALEEAQRAVHPATVAGRPPAVAAVAPARLFARPASAWAKSLI